MNTAALIGLTAPHSAGWLETLIHTPAIERIVVCDLEGVSPKSSDDLDGVYDSLDTLLASEELNLALVSVRNDQAPQVAKQLLSGGIPAIVEKPVARTAAEITELNALSREHSVPWATAFQNRLAPAVCEIRRLVSAGALGRVVSVEGRMVTSSVQLRNKDHWLFAKKIAGGGILHWLAIHTIDLVRYVTGLEYASVGAHIDTLSDTDIDVEDTAAVSFSLSNGAIGSIHAGYMLRRRYGDIGLTIRGTLGDVTWNSFGFDGASHTVYLQSEAPGWMTIDTQKIELKPKEGPGYGGSIGTEYVTQFSKAVGTRGDFVTDGEDALKAMEFVEAAYLANSSRQVVIL